MIWIFILLGIIIVPSITISLHSTCQQYEYQVQPIEELLSIKETDKQYCAYLKTGTIANLPFTEINRSLNRQIMFYFHFSCLQIPKHCIDIETQRFLIINRHHQRFAEQFCWQKQSKKEWINALNDCPQEWQIEIGGKCVDKCQVFLCRQCFHAQCGNYSTNADFMTQYRKFQKDFLSEAPIVDPEKMSFPLSTSGMKIVDSKGRRIRLAGANWYGFHLQRQVNNGLDKRKLSDIVSEIKSLFGLNSIRLPFSLQMLEDRNPVNETYVSSNPQLKGLRPLQVMDAVIKELTDQKIMVYLNNHISNSMWCCNMFDKNGLWYNNKYPEQKFFQAIDTITKRYRDNPLVIGIDLRNEIRADEFKVPLWQSKQIDKSLNWRTAAFSAAQIVNKLAPHWLIIIGAIDYQSDFRDIVKYPINLDHPNKIVYSGHVYSWFPCIKNDTNATEQMLFESQIHVRGLGVPYLLGEFGENNPSIFWNQTMEILKKTGLDWTYWPLNGYTTNSTTDESFGLYDIQFKSVRNQWMLNDLKQVGANPR